MAASHSFGKVYNNTDSNADKTCKASADDFCDFKKKLKVGHSPAKLREDIQRGGTEQAEALKDIKEKLGDDSFKRSLIKESLVEHLINILCEGEELDAKKVAISILKDMTYSNRTAREQLVEHTGVVVLIQEARDEKDQKYVNDCLITLGNTCSDNQDAKNQTLTLGGLSLGINLVKDDTNDMDVRSTAAGLLANLMKNQTVCKEIVSKNGIKFFAELIAHSESGCIANGCFALNSLIVELPEAVTNTISYPGLVSRLMKVIKQKPLSWRARCWSACVLLKLCQSSSEIVEKCRDQQLMADLVMLTRKIEADSRNAEYFTSQVKGLADLLSINH